MYAFIKVQFILTKNIVNVSPIMMVDYANHIGFVSPKK